MSVGRMAIFLTVASAIVFSLHYYLWTRLVRDMDMPPGWRTAGTVAVALLAVSMPASLVLSRAIAPSVGRYFFFACFAWMGLFFLILLSVVAADLVRVVLWAIRGGATLDEEKRTTLSRLLGGAALLLGAGVGFAGMLAAWRPMVKRVTVPLAKLPAPLSGLRIVQITDIHIGPTIGREFLQKLVDQVNALSPDVIAITGDLVDGSVATLRDQVEPLRGLKAAHGVFFVTGNHEYYSGAADWVAHLGSLGIRVLRNERVEITRDGSSLDLAGVDDFRARGLAPGHGHDLPGAMEGRDTSREIILLAHQPKSIFEAAEHGVGLQLSGHTHGGQIFPWTYLVFLEQPFVAGLHRVKESWVYVSQGTGFWGPPMRVGAPAEVTEITLVRA